MPRFPHRRHPRSLSRRVSAVEARTHRPAWKTLLAFAIIYFVWGSTFLAIRVGVREVPPFLLAAMRFLAAGLVLYGWMIARGERSPGARQWMFGVSNRFPDLRPRLRTVVLGRAACAFGHCGGHDGHYPGVYGTVGNHLPANAKAHRSPDSGAPDRAWRRRSAGEPIPEPRRGADRHVWRGRVDCRGDELVDRVRADAQTAPSRLRRP